MHTCEKVVVLNVGDWMILLGMILWAIIWIAIAFWPARVASRKGYSFVGFFLLSLLFFPLSLIIAYVMPDKYAQMPERSADDF